MKYPKGTFFNKNRNQFRFWRAALPNHQPYDEGVPALLRGLLALTRCLCFVCENQNVVENGAACRIRTGTFGMEGRRAGR